MFIVLSLTFVLSENKFPNAGFRTGYPLVLKVLKYSKFKLIRLLQRR